MQQRQPLKFGQVASVYDQFAYVQSYVFDYLCQYLISLDLHPSSILDIGSGTGKGTYALAHMFQDALCFGVDISAEMVAVAQKQHAHKRIFYRCQDATRPLTIDPVDLIVSNATFQWFNDPSKISALKSILNKNGTMVFSLFGPHCYQELAQSLMAMGQSSEGFPAKQFLWANTLSRDMGSGVTIDRYDQLMLRVKYPDLMTLLRQIHNTGVTYSKVLYSFLWTPAFVRKLESQYRERYGGIYATYHVYIGRIS